ncbi:hypothetical protein GW756_04800 [bacterium]|nr:hypothetical protein [bacterium]NCQ55697.1 hypothetical protein [Candidatus Parcubacteria bacterium]NCS67646.1 hypothetical protein [Candidatus Peregrinibacteria bacterium]NCS96660.1 hypothetical protein [bacterium]
MNKETQRLILLSLFSTLGLCFSANLAYLNWWKNDLAKDLNTVSKTQAFEKASDSQTKKARHSYAS